MDKTMLNGSGYKDKTAHDAMANVRKEQIRERDAETEKLIRQIKELVKGADYRLLKRIELQDIRTGKKYL